jgi:hypothetical protein
VLGARRWCLDRGMKLVSIESSEENDVINEAIYNGKSPLVSKTTVIPIKFLSMVNCLVSKKVYAFKLLDNRS